MLPETVVPSASTAIATVKTMPFISGTASSDASEVCYNAQESAPAVKSTVA